MRAQSAEQQARPKKLKGAPIIYIECLHNIKQVAGRKMDMVAATVLSHYVLRRNVPSQGMAMHGHAAASAC